MPLETNAKLSDVISVMNDMQGINQKAELASVIGSPATASDNMATQITKLQTAKNTLATNIASKGVVASDSDSLTTLADNVSQIVTGKKYAEGIYYTDGTTTLTVTGLDFRARVIHWYIGGTYLYQGFYNADINTSWYVKYASAYSDNDSKYGSSGVTVTDTGFTVDIGHYSSSVKWFAFE